MAREVAVVGSAGNPCNRDPAARAPRRCRTTSHRAVLAAAVLTTWSRPRRSGPGRARRPGPPAGERPRPVGRARSRAVDLRVLSNAQTAAMAARCGRPWRGDGSTRRPWYPPRPAGGTHDAPGRRGWMASPDMPSWCPASGQGRPPLARPAGQAAARSLTGRRRSSGRWRAGGR